MTATKPNETTAHEFVMSRMIRAPRDLVFKAWTDPTQLAKWWGPHGFTNPVCNADVRPGGAYRIVMRGPDGVDYPLTGVFKEIVPPERLVLTDDCAEHPAEWLEEFYKGFPEGVGRPSLEAVNTITFEDRGGKTLLTLRTVFTSQAVLDAMVKLGMEDGWSQSFEKLEALVKKM